MGGELHGSLAGHRSARRGDYRILYAVAADAIRIVRIEHRRHVYHRR